MLPKNATADEIWAAEHIQGYFQFWGKKGMQPAQDINLPILQGEEKIDPAKPVIRIGGTGKTRLDNQSLQISGVDLHAATLQLLSVLDKKYLYVGTLPTTGHWAEGLKIAGLAGKTLPFQNSKNSE